MPTCKVPCHSPTSAASGFFKSSRGGSVAAEQAVARTKAAELPDDLQEASEAEAAAVKQAGYSANRSEMALRAAGLPAGPLSFLARWARNEFRVTRSGGSLRSPSRTP